MATRALWGGQAAAAESDSPPARPRLHWARMLAWFPVLVVLAVSAIELALADRKYGLFTGGFGQSHAIDGAGDLALFFVGYAAAQGLVGLAGWRLATWLARRRPAWIACYIFALVNGALFLGVLAARYRLHSYFSDAVDFALLRELGGGSLREALLYGINEIAVAGVGLAAAALGALIVWHAARKFLPRDMGSAAGPRARWLPAGAVLFALLSFAVHRSGNDAPFGLARTLAWSVLNDALNVASDVDGDGYGLFWVRHDTAPFDGARHPLALDIPGNGVDEDGYGGDLSLVPLAAPLGPQVFAGKRPHVVVVVFESTRGDVLGKRIGGKVVAPNLEALAAGGDVARPSYSHVGFTSQSMKSLFTGRLAPRPSDPSLFTDFAASGYRIGVFSGQSEHFGGIARTVSSRSAADVFIDARTLREKRTYGYASDASLKVDETDLIEAFDASMGREPWASPHFLYFNFQSGHFPYYHEGLPNRITAHPLDRSEISADRADEVAATYWNAIAHADAALGLLIARLKAKGVWDDTILIVTGDHGEELFETGFLGHGHVINREQFQTLLVANRPGILPDAPIALADYRAIVAAAVKGEPPPSVTVPPFMHIGPLDTPTAIGIAGPGGRLTSLRLDTGEACFVEQRRCAAYDSLTGEDRARADAAVARWGSERWRWRRRGR